MITSHNGKFTVKNNSTGNHRTFQVKTQREDAKFAPGKRVISLLNGPDNENDYIPFGFVDEHGIYLWNSKRSEFFEWVQRFFRDPSKYPSCELLEETKCRKCNRTLTTPDSILSGIGPECAKKRG